MMSRVFSPYDFNLAGWNPLRNILIEGIDFSQVTQSPIKLFITVTNVATGRPRVFRNGDLTPEVLIASACLPTMFQAVEIDGEAYWDGGYSGTRPSHRSCANALHATRSSFRSIRLSAKARAHGQRDSQSAQRGGVNAVLLKELRMIALLRQVADPGHEEGEKWAKMRVHFVTNDIMTELNASSKMIAEWDFLCMLRDEDAVPRKPSSIATRTTSGIAQRLTSTSC